MADFDDADSFEPNEAWRRPSASPTAPPRRPLAVTTAPTTPAPNSLERPLADSEVPASFDGEDFLFHLYRGSELLQDNCVAEAKEELERALRVQPQDIEGQGLLGVVYFRLGLYPRAIEIYQRIVEACPDEISPRVNLALCFMKTGQGPAARESLEHVTRRVPEHARAWGYLGLVYERLADYERAHSAFERAGQPNLARRMQQVLSGAASGQPPPARRTSLAGRLGPAVPSIPEPAELSRSRASDPPHEPAGLTSEPPSDSGRPPRSLEGPASGVMQTEKPLSARGRSVLVDVNESWGLRSAAVRGLLSHGSPFSNTPLARRVRGKELSEPLGGPGSPWLEVKGSGQVLISAAPERELCALELSDAPVYVRESCLVAFAGSARYENGRLPSGGGEPIAVVQLSGRGTVLIESRKPPHVLAVSENQKLAVRIDDVVGWVGRLLGQPLDLESSPLKASGFVAFSGSGSVLVDLG